MRVKIIHCAALSWCACCSGLSVSQAHAAPVISEVFYDAIGGDAGHAFLELFGTPGESLQGLVVEGVNGGDGTVYRSIELSGVIPADGIFVIGDDDGASTFVGDADFIADVDFQNGPDSVVLRNELSILDAVAYGSFAAGDVPFGEGEPAADAPAGSSIARLNPFVDSNDNSVDFAVLSVPTPASVPAVSAVPLPAGLWLFVSGLATLFAGRYGWWGRVQRMAG
jgi:hypothetical protein